ncbi:serine/threonine-protein phosphatase with EF-hands 1 isoform X3 [Cynocephalus volans]|uniref:serine/threonine-protein phosphatase with EF-hands 1 isoform X3 n=1 Tax=Cynocephalus volans TaxID=110931 RepID=UPI002FC95DAC
MGCGSSSMKDKKSETVLKAALIIQNWYRRYRARLKARQHYALTIFQSIEYADEQGQMQLSNFFSFMLENYALVCEQSPQLIRRLFESTLQDIKDRQDYVALIDVPDSYDGPRLQFPLTFTDIDLLIEAFKQQQILHAHYVLEVLFETKKILKQMPNFTHIKTSPSKGITICGDLHGKLDDLFLIFYKNGLPSGSNPYIFNGDFVDRGSNSMEILMILFVSFLVYPNDLHLNRGNHEDFMMNMRYGFTREVLYKYKLHGKKILQILEDLYTWLPIGTIIDNEILVIHGGISESTDLNLLHRLERNKMKSVLMPPMSVNGNLTTDLKKNKGGVPVAMHGRLRASQSFSEQLSKNEWGQVVTVFSASNYYEEGSNRGAYIKLSSGMTPRFFQYQVTKATCMRPLHQRVDAMECSAIRILRERIIARKTDLIRAFQLQDYTKSGKLSKTQWAFSMEKTLGLNLPWRSLSSHLVKTDKDGNIDYMSSFQDIRIEKPVKEIQSTLVETLYRYRSDLQIIFNIMDSDHSGLISMEEFRAMWRLFSLHYNVEHIDDSHVDELASSMDFNKDGSIDFNEFLKAFYVVHKFDKLAKSDTTLAEQE